MKGQTEKLLALAQRLIKLAQTANDLPKEWKTATDECCRLVDKRSVSHDEMAHLEDLVEAAEKTCAA